MTQRECGQCGTSNPLQARFCSGCDRYLWDATAAAAAVEAERPAIDDQTITLISGKVGTIDDRQSARPPAVSAGESEIVLDPRTGGGVDLQVTNGSSIVDGFRIEALDPPPWLNIESTPVRLMPGTDSAVRVETKIRSGTLALAQALPLRLRVHSLTDETKTTDITVTLRVPPIGGPPTIRCEPVAVRLRDATSGEFAVHLDNRGCNHPRRCVLSGVDDEGVVQFTFTPPVVELPAEGRGTAAARFTSPALEPGAQVNRRLIVRATEGDQQVETSVSLVQHASEADPPVRLRLQPELLRTLDVWSTEVLVIVDNRGGSRTRRLVVQGRDKEERIRFTPRVGEVVVQAGGEARVRLGLEARAPEAGKEVARMFVVAAAEDDYESEVSGSWVQSSSQAPIATAKLELEPEHLRVRDQQAGRFIVVVDNRRGARPLRVRLSADDPENIVQYSLQPPVLDIPPGGSARSYLMVAAPLPPYGQGAVRALRVRASDDHGMIEADAVFEQSTSPTPLSTARMDLDPQQLVAGGSRSGRLRVRLDNRAGASPLHVRLVGSDPERVVRFSFVPPVVEVPPGQVGWAVATVSAPRPSGGQQAVRPLTVVADDGQSSIEATGSFVQSSRPLRPILRIVLTLLGALLVAIGALLPWLASDDGSGLPTIPQVVDTVVDLTSTPPPSDVQDVAALLQRGQPVERLATLVMAGLMAFGLLGQRGRLTRITALLVLATMAAACVFYSVVGFDGLGIGALLVILGGIIGFAGGQAAAR